MKGVLFGTPLLKLTKGVRTIEAGGLLVPLALLKTLKKPRIKSNLSTPNPHSYKKVVKLTLDALTGMILATIHGNTITNTAEAPTSRLTCKLNLRRRRRYLNRLGRVRGNKFS